MKRHKIFFSIGCFIAFAALPARVFAAVQITEIMYDVSGTDTGREWVEITNLGTSAVDVGGFKFFEANTNHGLTVSQGSPVLQPQSSAIIVEDQAKFLADWPSFHGPILKSSFSLSNTGETIEIKDATLVVQDSATYDSSMGAAGDGNSLNRLSAQASSGAAFGAAAPSPGIFLQSGAQSQSQSSTNDSAPLATTTSAATNATPPASFDAGSTPPVTVHITGDTTVSVGGGSYFSGAAFGTQGLPLQNVRYVWNFGDGTIAEGQTVFHAYAYPGVYVLSLDVASGFSAGLARVSVEAVAAQVALVAEADGSLSVCNNSSKDVDIGLWTLANGSSSFIIPKNTMVLAHSGVRFSFAVTRVVGDTNAKLLYPNGAVAALADPSADSPLRGQAIAVAGVSSASTPAVPQATRAQTAGLVLGVQSEKAASQPTASASDPAPAPAAVAGAEGGAGVPMWSWFLGLAGLLVLGLSGVWFVRAHAPAPETTPDDAEFDIE